MNTWLDPILFGIFPYVALAVAVVGCLQRARHRPLTWKTGSSQMLESRSLRLGSILFHVGMINLMLGHVFGLLTPPTLYHGLFGLETSMKQVIEIAMGFLMTPPAMIGCAILIWRRLVDERVKASSAWGDLLLLSALFVQLALGFLTIPQSMHHLDGSVMLKITGYTRGLATLDFQAWRSLEGVHWIYRLHILAGFAFVLALPFTRLVHVLSGLVIVRYLVRPWQVVRRGAWQKP
jgi:nitrate reductase gamma subunit